MSPALISAALAAGEPPVPTEFELDTWYSVTPLQLFAAACLLAVFAGLAVRTCRWRRTRRRR